MSFLIQTLPAEGDISLRNGNFTSTISLKDLKHVLRGKYHLSHDTPLRIVGVGAMDCLCFEIAFLGEKVYKIFKQGDTFQWEEIDDTGLISFSQVAIENVPGVTKKVTFPHVTVDGTTDKTIFERIQTLLGHEKTFSLKMKTKLTYIKSRAVCPIIKETGKKITPSAGFDTMFFGGRIIRDGKTLTIQAPDELVKHFETPETIEFTGVLTGNDLKENELLKGLHIHCLYGHVLELGDLIECEIHYTPISQCLVLEPGKDPKTESSWRPLT